MLYSSVCLFVAFVSCLSPAIADDPQETLRHPTIPQANTHRIAIIGAGAGGSSASYFLDKFSEAIGLEVPLEVTVFDSNTYIGGRTTTVSAFEDENYPVELGGSIFVKINHILYNASQEFGLRASSKIYQAAEDSKYDLGIWDGGEFVFRAENDDDEDKGSWRGWWDIAKLLWKYGLAPIRTRRETSRAIGKFLDLYEEPWFPFASLQEAIHKSGLAEYTKKSGDELLKEIGVGDLFAREIIQASTRVNYASNLGGIHGLETLVCMAIEGAMAIDGGNWQIFAEMAKSSAQRIFLNTTVTEVAKDPKKGTFKIHTSNDALMDTSNNEYDTVILAAPHQFANIKFTPGLESPPKEVPYNAIYVTLFTSPHRPSPGFFGLESQADVPSTVLTTLTDDLNDKLAARHGRQAVGPAGFWSISTLRVLFTNPKSPEPQYLYKIFSPAPLTASFLAQLFDITHTPTTATAMATDPISSLPTDVITWSHEKEWYAYPYEMPTETFENFTLAFADQPSQYDGSSGLWYLNGMESFISTMETSALAGRNVARLIVDRLDDEAKAGSYA